MSEKKESYEANKVTDKRHYRRKSKVRPASGAGHMLTGNTKPAVQKNASLTQHFKGGHG